MYNEDYLIELNNAINDLGVDLDDYGLDLEDIADFDEEDLEALFDYFVLETQMEVDNDDEDEDEDEDED